MTNREIDALVAEKVMGFDLVHSDLGSFWTPMISHPFSIGGKPAGTMPAELPHYSTNIADAFRVVEKVAEYDRLGFRIEHLCENSGEKWIARFPTTSVPDCEEMDPDANEAEADTAPLAICLAALKAVGVKAQEGE